MILSELVEKLADLGANRALETAKCTSMFALVLLSVRNTVYLIAVTLLPLAGGTLRSTISREFDDSAVCLLGASPRVLD